jgi:C4-dicarboxylate transporter DctQ subunit
MRAIRSILSILDRVVGFVESSIASIGIAGGVALAFYNVVARYLFDSSLTWAGELTVYLFLWSTFFGASYCFRQDAHIAVGVLLEKVSPRIARYLMLFSYLVTFVFLASVSWYGYEYLLLDIELDERSIDLDIPMWIPYLAIPVAFAFSAYRVAQKFFATLRGDPEAILRKSEAEMIISEMGEGATESLVKDVEKRTGGML